MGIVTDAVKRYVPASFNALAGVTNSYNYTLDDLQTLADYVQFRYFATVPGGPTEAAVWNPVQAEFLGILTTLEFIPAAIDYWGDQLSAQSTQPTDENVTYFDRRTDLWKIYDRLITKAAQLAPIVGVNIVRIKGNIPKVSYGDNGRNILVTSDPKCFPPAFADPNDLTYVSWQNIGWKSVP